MITLREYEPETDYDMIADWWRGHGSDPVPKVVLPAMGAIAVRDTVSNGVGVIEEVAAAWCYRDNSVGVAMLEWVISKPDTPGAVLKVAFEAITDFYKDDLKANGYTVLAAHCASDKLANIFGLNGFARVEKVNHMIMGI